MVADRYMTSSLLAEYRGESKRSAKRFMLSGKVPVYRDGSRLRVLKSEVDAYMKSCRVDPKPQSTSLKSMLDRIAETARARKKVTA